MSSFRPFGPTPYEKFQQDMARVREERLRHQNPQTRPRKGVWPGKYPTHVDELPDSLADLPDWTDEDIRQLDKSIYTELFGSRHSSLAPAIIQLEKKERSSSSSAPNQSFIDVKSLVPKAFYGNQYESNSSEVVEKVIHSSPDRGEEVFESEEDLIDFLANNMALDSGSFEYGGFMFYEQVFISNTETSDTRPEFMYTYSKERGGEQWVDKLTIVPRGAIAGWHSHPSLEHGDNFSFATTRDEDGVYSRYYYSHTGDIAWVWRHKKSLYLITSDGQVKRADLGDISEVEVEATGPNDQTSTLLYYSGEQ